MQGCIPCVVLCTCRNEWIRVNYHAQYAQCGWNPSEIRLPYSGLSKQAHFSTDTWLQIWDTCHFVFKARSQILHEFQVLPHEICPPLPSCQVVEWQGGMRSWREGERPGPDKKLILTGFTIRWFDVGRLLSHLCLCRICPLPVLDGLIWIGGKWRQDPKSPFVHEGRGSESACFKSASLNSL